jgi:hypothetical protein
LTGPLAKADDNRKVEGVKRISGFRRPSKVWTEEDTKAAWKFKRGSEVKERVQAGRVRERLESFALEDIASLPGAKPQAQTPHKDSVNSGFSMRLASMVDMSDTPTPEKPPSPATLPPAKPSQVPKIKLSLAECSDEPPAPGAEASPGTSPAPNSAYYVPKMTPSTGTVEDTQATFSQTSMVCKN